MHWNVNQTLSVTLGVYENTLEYRDIFYCHTLIGFPKPYRFSIICLHPNADSTISIVMIVWKIHLKNGNKKLKLNLSLDEFQHLGLSKWMVCLLKLIVNWVYLGCWVISHGRYISLYNTDNLTVVVTWNQHVRAVFARESIISQWSLIYNCQNTILYRGFVPEYSSLVLNFLTQAFNYKCKETQVEITRFVRLQTAPLSHIPHHRGVCALLMMTEINLDIMSVPSANRSISITNTSLV